MFFRVQVLLALTVLEKGFRLPLPVLGYIVYPNYKKEAPKPYSTTLF